MHAMILVTGADRTDAASLAELLESVHRHEPGLRPIVYDLGMLPEQRAKTELLPEAEFRAFGDAQESGHSDARLNTGIDVWKPGIIWSVLESSTEVVLWIDPGYVVTESLGELESRVLSNGFYSPRPIGGVLVGTDPGLIGALGLESGWAEDQVTLSLGLMGFDPLNPRARRLSRDWATHQLRSGSGGGKPRADHEDRRQQVMLSILAWQQGLTPRTDLGHMGVTPQGHREEAKVTTRRSIDRVHQISKQAFAVRREAKPRARGLIESAFRGSVSKASSLSRGVIPPHVISPKSIRAYIPNSSGGMDVRLALAEQAVAQTPDLIAAVAEHFSASAIMRSTSTGFAEMVGAGDAGALAVEFNAQSSDKASVHDYHHVYAAILRDLGDVSAVLEVGMGTNHEDVVSNMGALGVPGASLRAWRSYLPHAQIFGADVDRRILFTDERIQTFLVDQTKMTSVDALASELPDDLDLVIDDGLHSPNANLAILLLGLRKVRPGGWIVIEDICEEAGSLWSAIAGLFPPAWRTYLVSTQGNAYMFCAKRPIS